MRKSPLIQAITFYLWILCAVLASAGALAVFLITAGLAKIQEPAETPAKQLQVESNGTDEAMSFSRKSILLSPMIPVDTSLTYVLSAQARNISPPGPDAEGAQTYLGFSAFDADGVMIGREGEYRYAATSDYYLYPEAGWASFSGIISGFSDDDEHRFPPGTKYVRIVALLNYHKGDPQPDAAFSTTEIRAIRFAPKIELNVTQ